MNNVKVFVLMAGLTALIGAFGAALGGTGGLVLALVLAGGMNLFMYWNSASMVLRSYGARVVDRAQAPELYEMVDRLPQRAGLPMPTVAIAPHDQPKAFATGRNPQHGVVAVTSGLLRLLDERQVRGVIAHELAHIKNRDIHTAFVLSMTFATPSAFPPKLARKNERNSESPGSDAVPSHQISASNAESVTLVASVWLAR